MTTDTEFLLGLRDYLKGKLVNAETKWGEFCSDLPEQGTVEYLNCREHIDDVADCYTAESSVYEDVLEIINRHFKEKEKGENKHE